MDRRRFLKVTAITGTSAALASCGNPENQIIRFVPDEEITPGHRRVEAERVPAVRRRLRRARRASWTATPRCSATGSPA